MIDNWIDCHFPEAELVSNGTELRINCPFCDARNGSVDTKRHLYVSLVAPKAHCFRCDWSGNHVGLVMSVSGLTYSRALIELGNPAPDIKRFDRIYSPKGLVQGQKLAMRPDGFIPLSIACNSSIEARAAYNYLMKRHVPLDLIQSRFGIVSGTNRVWILVDSSFWQGRLLAEGDPKYENPPWPKGAALWNAAALRLQDVWIVEGVFGAIAVGDMAIALCGKSATPEQIYRMASATNVERYTIALDKGAEMQAETLADELIKAGYRRGIKLLYLNGQPDDGIDGKEIVWDWDTKIRQRLAFI